MLAMSKPTLAARLALAALFILPASLPALAGPAETALLASYAGTWAGTGIAAGPQPGDVDCRITFKATSAGKLIYNGRCSFSSGAASFNGTMIYNDAAKRFEAASSSTGFTATTIGKKQGGNIVFSMDGQETTYGTASSTMTLSSKAINISFKLVDKKGETTSSKITFSRS
jgi:hypothetical protein